MNGRGVVTADTQDATAFLPPSPNGPTFWEQKKNIALRSSSKTAWVLTTHIGLRLDDLLERMERRNSRSRPFRQAASDSYGENILRKPQVLGVAR
jgi:hypothetical protein